VAISDGIAADAVGLHAGEGETSEMLALRPDLVLLERIVPGCCEDLADLMPRLRRDGLRSVTPTGTLGDARNADRERGARYIAAEIDGYRRAVDGSLGVEEGPVP
jgi:creatinine amidohydrolase